MRRTRSTAPSTPTPRLQSAWTALMLTPAMAALAWLAALQGWVGPDAGLLALVGCIAWLASAVQALPSCHGCPGADRPPHERTAGGPSAPNTRR